MPNTREKLIELIDDVQQNGISYERNFQGWTNPYLDLTNTELADHLIANGVTVQKWIPVKERLPEYDQVVLCYKDDRGVRIGKHMPATYADGVVAFKDLARDYAFGATHWMPLPEPPKGE